MEKMTIKNRYYKYLALTPCFLSLVSCLLLFVVCLLSPASQVNAQETGKLGLSVSPQIFEIDVFPGEKVEEVIRVGNISKVALPILVRTADFTAADNSGEMLSDESSQDPSFASRFWFNLINPNFILDPDERQDVKFSIEVPKNAELGGHYAVMLFEPQLPSFYFQEGQPRAIPVVGVLFLISVRTLNPEEEIKEKLEVVEFSIPKEERMTILENILSRATAGLLQVTETNIVENPPSKFILRIKNNDIYHIKPSGKVLIYNLFGQKVGEADVLQKTILPGKIREFPIEFTPQLPEKLKWLPAGLSQFLLNNIFIGKYNAVLSLGAKSPLKAEILRTEAPIILDFFFLPWKFWLPFLAIFFFILFFVSKYKNRVKTALKILFNPKI